MIDTRTAHPVSWESLTVILNSEDHMLDSIADAQHQLVGYGVPDDISKSFDVLSSGEFIASTEYILAFYRKAQIAKNLSGNIEGLW